MSVIVVWPTRPIINDACLHALSANPLKETKQPSTTRTRVAERALELSVALLPADVAVALLAQRPVDERQLPQLLLLVCVVFVVDRYQELAHQLRRRLHLP